MTETVGVMGLNEWERASIIALLEREWRSHSVVTPEVREHLDRIEALMTKLNSPPLPDEEPA